MFVGPCLGMTGNLFPAWLVPGLSVVLGVATATSAVSCPSGWFFNPLHQSCLKPFAQKVTWYAARDHCSLLSSTLVHVDSQDMNDFLTKNVLDMNILSQRYIWIASNDILREGEYRGIHNRLMTYTAWYSTQPNDDKQDGPHTQNCVMHMLPSEEQEDRTCDDTSRPYEYVCELWLADTGSALFRALDLDGQPGSTIRNFGFGPADAGDVAETKNACAGLCMRSRFACDAFLYNHASGTCRFLRLFQEGRSEALKQAEVEAMKSEESEVYIMRG